jgi:hypothetical protein
LISNGWKKLWDWFLTFNTDYKSKCAFGSFQSQRRFDLVTAFTIVYFKTHLWRILKYNWYNFTSCLTAGLQSMEGCCINDCRAWVFMRSGYEGLRILTSGGNSLISRV